MMSRIYNMYVTLHIKASFFFRPIGFSFRKRKKEQIMRERDKVSEKVRKQRYNNFGFFEFRVNCKTSRTTRTHNKWRRKLALR